MSLIKALKHTFLNAVPMAFGGNYTSENDYYRNVVERYYPKDGLIILDTVSHDKKNYLGDLKTAFSSYRKNASLKIDNCQKHINE